MRKYQRYHFKSSILFFAFLLFMSILFLGGSSKYTLMGWLRNLPVGQEPIEQITLTADQITDVEMNSMVIADVGGVDLTSQNMDTVLDAEINEESNQKSNQESNINNLHSLSELQVHFIDVGQGDSTLIFCDGEAMLIDAGNNTEGEVVVEYLAEQGIDHLKYLIGTHPDYDHIGGLDTVINAYDSSVLFMPDIDNQTESYKQVIDLLYERDLAVTLPIVGKQYTLGSAVFTILAPTEKDPDCINNNSIVVLVTHGQNRFLFMADAQAEEEEKLLAQGIDLSADVLKVGHHGSETSTEQDFLDAVHPSFGVISCGENNEHGLPDASTMEKLKRSGIEVFRTDEQGTIVMTSDGTKIWWNTVPSLSWAHGEK